MQLYFSSPTPLLVWLMFSCIFFWLLNDIQHWGCFLICGLLHCTLLWFFVRFGSFSHRTVCSAPSQTNTQQHKSRDNIHITYWPVVSWNVFPKLLLGWSEISLLEWKCKYITYKGKCLIRTNYLLSARLLPRLQSQVGELGAQIPAYVTEKKSDPTLRSCPLFSFTSASCT